MNYLQVNVTDVENAEMVEADFAVAWLLFYCNIEVEAAK